MPNRAEHTEWGQWAGGGWAFYKALEENGSALRIAIETAAGVLGGHWGARMPDIFDPPTSPRHRDLAHSWTATLSLLTIVRDWLNSQVELLRTKVAAIREDRERGGEATGFDLRELALHALIGAINGFLAGYLSHLALDSRTARGLPVI